jgi:hypothetical protein
LKGISTRAEIGSLKSKEITLSSSHRFFREEMDVLPGTSSLQISLGASSETKTEPDLYLYDCTDEKNGCGLKQAGTAPNVVRKLLVDHPATGKWIAVIDGSGLFKDPRRIVYQEVMTNPRYGRAEVSQTPEAVAPGGSWKIEVKPYTIAVPSRGRRPVVLLLVEDRKVFEFSQNFKKTYPERSRDQERSGAPVVADTVVPICCQKRDATNKGMVRH